MKKTQIVISGDNVETLKNYPDNYFDSVVTDCPYGLGKEPNAEEMLKAWIDTGYLEVKGSGFMGKEWDSFVPQPLFWKEIYRVLKYGGHIVAFFGTRTYDWGCMSIRLGGFEIRDCIQWVYGSGFPKSHNVSKAINKMSGVEYDEIRASGVGFMKADSKDWNVTKNQLIQKGESTEQAKQWEGWGSALKPANEPIVLARKPLEKGLSIAENVLKWGTGGINIDVSRIGLSKGDDKRLGGNGTWKTDKTANNVYEGGYEGKDIESSVLGRFPSNFIMTHHEDCEDLICVDDCPIKIIDEQSGISKRASRFFYVAKASQWERSFGLDEFEEKIIEGTDKGQDERAIAYKTRPTPKKNIHPTIKPIKLMQYLIRLVTQPNGIVLDAFAGSGTTGIACKIDGFEFVGLEISEEFTAIANQRIESFNEEKLLLDETIVFKTRNKKEKTDTNTQSKEQLNLF